MGCSICTSSDGNQHFCNGIRDQSLLRYTIVTLSTTKHIWRLGHSHSQFYLSFFSKIFPHFYFHQSVDVSRHVSLSFRYGVYRFKILPVARLCTSTLATDSSSCHKPFKSELREKEPRRQTAVICDITDWLKSFCFSSQKPLTVIVLIFYCTFSECDEIKASILTNHQLPTSPKSSTCIEHKLVTRLGEKHFNQRENTMFCFVCELHIRTVSTTKEDE